MALFGSAVISLCVVVISLAISSPNFVLAVSRRMSRISFQAAKMKYKVPETASTGTTLVFRENRERHD